MNIYPDFPNWTLYNIANHPGSGYQISLTISWKSGMKVNFDDIRFHDIDENILNYYIESSVNSYSAIVWVKLSSSTKFYLRWGNSSAVSESNPDNVFEFFEDFSSSTLDINKWDSYGNSPIISNSELTYNSDISYNTNQIGSKAIFSINKILECKAKSSSVNETPAYLVMRNSLNSINCGVYIYGNTTDNNIYLHSSVNSTFTQDQIVLPSTKTSYQIYKAIWATNYVATYQNNIFLKSHTSNVYSGNCNFYIIGGGVTTGRSTTWDWVRIRKYVAVEPTIVNELSGNIDNTKDIYPDFPNWTLYNITNHPGSGYQIMLTISWESGMNTDFSDIRFHDIDENILNYYIESYTSGISAQVWIKLSSLIKFYLRWGNSSAVSESNPDNVFEFFEDFLGSTINSNIWVAQGLANGTVTVDDSKLTITSTGSSAVLVKTIGDLSTDNSVVDVKVMSTHNDSTHTEIVRYYTGSTYFMQALLSFNGTPEFSNYFGSTTSVNITGWTANVYHVLTCKRVGKSVWYVDYANEKIITSDYNTSSGVIFFETLKANALISVDWVRVRKSAVVEPTVIKELSRNIDNLNSVISNKIFLVYPDFPNWSLYSINNHPGSGYQMNITVPWKPGMKMNFDDIRFHDQNENIINYYIASYTSGVSANVLIKLTSFKKLYLRWGNGSAKSESNPDKVYDFYENFPGTTLRSSKWNGTVNTTTYTVANNCINITNCTGTWMAQYDNSQGTQILSTCSLPTNFILDYTVEVFSDSTIPLGQAGMGLVGSDNKVHVFGGISDYLAAQTVNVFSYSRIETVNCPDGTFLGNPVKRDMRIVKNGTSISIYQKQTNEQNWTFLFTNTSNNISKLAITTAVLNGYPFFKYAKLSNISVKKYASVEPTLVYVISGYSSSIKLYSVQESESELLTLEYPSNNNLSYNHTRININDERLGILLDSFSTLHIPTLFMQFNSILNGLLLETFSSIENPVLCRQVNDIWNEFMLYDNQNDVNIDTPSYININDLNIILYPLNSDDIFYYWNLFKDRSSIAKYDVFYNNNDIKYKNLEYLNSSDSNLFMLYGYLTDINLYGKYVNETDTLLDDLVYENINDLRCSIFAYDPVNILLSRNRFTHNNIKYNLYLKTMSDRFLKAYTHSINNIFSNLADNLLVSTDININTVFDKLYNDLYGGCKVKSYNDIYIYGGNSVYFNLSDIDVLLNVYAINDMTNYPRLVATSNLLLELDDLVAVNKILVSQYLHDTSDLNYLYRGLYDNRNDLFTHTEILFLNDFGVDGLRHMNIIHDTGDIFENYGMLFRSDVNVLDTYRTFSNLYGGAKFKFRHDMYYHFDRVNNSKIRISDVFRANNDIPPLLRILNRNQILGRIKSNRKEYLNNKLPAPFVEEREFERSGVLPIYPNSNLFFVFSDIQVKIFNPLVDLDIENIPNCKGVGWFNDNGAEFLVFNKPINVHEVNVYINFYNCVTLHLEANTHIYRGIISYANKTTDLDSTFTYTTIKDIILLVNRIGFID